MGRAKLKMELITKEKIRNSTFHKRKAGILKKANEFTILCDVDTLMIIYPPNSNKPQVWPENPEKIDKIISSYKSKKQGESGKKCCDLNDFFLDRKRKIEDELSKARKKNLEAKYATWSDELNHYSEDELRRLVMQLENKENVVRNLLEFKKSNMKNIELPVMLDSNNSNNNSNSNSNSKNKQAMFYNYMDGSGSSCHHYPYLQMMNHDQHDRSNGWFNNAAATSAFEPMSFAYPVICSSNDMMMNQNQNQQWAYQQQAMLQAGQLVPDIVFQDIRYMGMGDYGMNYPRGSYQG